ncbi:LPXTG cell wall anchor domain-containing protein [Streptomyces sp. NPDC002908]|uniref:LPXTG cell wall anchor domain-containing protein n=1 Tax=Streptomyces sp. NPDC002908 TaxID=3364670 RepID=UPI0036846241
MSTPIRTRIRARTAACLASILAAGILTTGLPALQSQAEAAPAPIRCDKKWLGKEYGSPPSNSGIQGKNQAFSQRPQNEWDDYWFENPSHAFDGLKKPTQAQSDLAGNTDADAQKWKKQFENTQNPKYRVLEIYARYNAQAGKSTGLKNWGTWLDQRLIGYEANRLKGDGFEAKVVRDYKLVGPDWICQKNVPVFDKDGKPVIDPKTGKQAVRKYDAYNAKTKELVEFKSNGKHIPKQLRYDSHILRNKEYGDHKLRLITGSETAKNTVKQYDKLNKQLADERGSQNQATVREHRSQGAPRWRANQYTRYNPIMNPDPRRVGSVGPINDAAFRSGSTPDQARQIQHQYRNANGNGVFGRGGPGGIDFSTLELNYVGSPVKGKGLDYSFQADYAKDPENNPGWGGKAKLRLASDAMFTWLALTPDKFWVNLNPDQPDKIMDKTFGKTDAGRVLLEADLEMKHDYAKDMDPRQGIGKQYWDAMNAANIPCGHQIRLWIVPKTAQVRVEDDGIYILDAPLKVNSEPQSVEHPSPNGACTLTEAQIRTSQRLVEQYVIPDVEQKVNSGAAYADLRRVYSSRVAAEYIRDQDKDRATDFRPLIDSDDVARWPLSTEHASWTPKQTWDAYMKSYTQGDYSYPCNIAGENKTCVMGGVDFSKSPKRNIPRVRFDLEHPRLDKDTKTSVKAETAYRDSGTALIGGNGSGQTGGGDEDPVPTPTPTPSPSDEPSTPAPSDTPSGKPSTPAGGDKPAPPAQGPEGDLADTGSSTPVALIAGIAAALAVAGGALTWWMRRRRSGTA